MVTAEKAGWLLLALLLAWALISGVSITTGEQEKDTEYAMRAPDVQVWRDLP
jgi:hypothetical protein